MDVGRRLGHPGLPSRRQGVTEQGTGQAPGPLERAYAGGCNGPSYWCPNRRPSCDPVDGQRPHQGPSRVPGQACAALGSREPQEGAPAQALLCTPGSTWVARPRCLPRAPEGGSRSRIPARRDPSPKGPFWPFNRSWRPDRSWTHRRPWPRRRDRRSPRLCRPSRSRRRQR